MKKKTIHYIEQENGTYTEEQRLDGVAIHIRENVYKDVADQVLNTSSSLYRGHGTLRELLEDDSEYAQWLSQMGNDPNDTDPAIVAIRKILPYKPL